MAVVFLHTAGSGPATKNGAAKTTMSNGVILASAITRVRFECAAQIQRFDSRFLRRAYAPIKQMFREYFLLLRSDRKRSAQRIEGSRTFDLTFLTLLRNVPDIIVDELRQQEDRHLRSSMLI